MNSPKLILTTLISICVMRIVAISLFYILGENSQVTNNIINDPWHHYQLGLLILLLGFLNKKFEMGKILAAIGLGIFLEEWPVFLSDLGLKTLHIYHTKIDFIGIFLLVGSYFLLISYKKRGAHVARSTNIVK